MVRVDVDDSSNTHTTYVGASTSYEACGNVLLIHDASRTGQFSDEDNTYVGDVRIPMHRVLKIYTEVA